MTEKKQHVRQKLRCCNKNLNAWGDLLSMSCAVFDKKAQTNPHENMRCADFYYQENFLTLRKDHKLGNEMTARHI